MGRVFDLDNVMRRPHQTTVTLLGDHDAFYGVRFLCLKHLYYLS